MELKLSHRLQVKPLAYGAVKVFRLCGSGDPDEHIRDEKTGKPVPAYNAGAHFEGYFPIYDRFEPNKAQAKKILRNVVGSAVVIKDGKEVLEDTIEPITFNSKGICVVKHDEYNKLVCLTRANENKSNPYRNKSTRAVWEEVDAAVTQEEIINDVDLAYNAEKYAMECDIKEAEVIAKKMSCHWKDVKELRASIRMKARSNPKEFFRNTKDKAMILKLQIDDAKRLNLIDLTEDNTWIWLEKDGVDRKLVEVEVGKNPVEVLVEYFTKTNKEDNRRLVNELDKIMHQPLEN